MKDRELKNSLQQSLQLDIQPQRFTETITLCKEIVREQHIPKDEPRTSFFQYLSDVFQFEGIPTLGWQTMTLLSVCLIISSLTDVLNYIPGLMPLFVLAIMPVIFKSQFYGMGEIEAATRASGAQIILAKLVLAGAANLVCITIVLCFEVYLQNSCRGIGQMILYCLVPYLVCMSAMLRLVRLRKKESMRICTVTMLGSCICWSLSIRVLPWIYKTSAIGLWIIAFFVFTTFFIKEIYFIIEMRKEGKMYGIVA